MQGPTRRRHSLAILRSWPAAVCTAACASGHSRSVMRRRLAAEGTGYREVVDEVRRGLADQLLAVGLPVADVATRLGYSEAAALAHAHHRWTGTPPSSRRRPSRADDR